MNNEPTADDVKTSKNSARAGFEAVYIHVNATDVEDLEQYLMINRIEWRENNSESGNPPTDIWHIDSNKISINLDEGYSGGGYLRASMVPSSTAYRGRHDIRVRVEDLDGDISEWITLMNAFEVIDDEPILMDVTLQYHEVFRGDTIFITLNASDLGQPEHELTVEIQYRKVGGTWVDIMVTPDMYHTPGGYWEIPFSPGFDWLDGQLGEYEFHARVKNDVPAYSNGGAWTPTNNQAEVKNNVPEAISLFSDDLSIGVSQSTLINANGDDREVDEDDLEVFFEYSYYDGTTWETTYLDDLDYNNGQTQWEIIFTPESGASLGSYYFRVRFFDGEDYSDWLLVEDLVEVYSGIPAVKYLRLDMNEMSRIETATLSADSRFDSGSNEDLIPVFEYKTSSGSWMSNEETGSYFAGDPSYSNSEWSIEFIPPLDADLGLYSFRVRFSDGTNTSDWTELTDSLELINQPPQIEDITVPSTGKRLDPIDIFIDASDPDFPEEALNLSLEYKSPSGELMSHGDSGSYFTGDPQFVGAQWRVPFTAPAGSELGAYSFRVKISDGDNETNWLTLTDAFILVENPNDPDDDGLKNDVDTDDDGDGTLDVDDPDPLDPSITKEDVTDPMTSFLLLFIVFLVIIIIVLLVTRKKKPEYVPIEDTKVQEDIPKEDDEVLEDIPEEEPENDMDDLEEDVSEPEKDIKESQIEDELD
jgi:hypothetical protein